MPITIRDLAKKLNLSITTVSRAIDGYSDVSEKTRTRVIHAAEEMGYAPSSAARQLRRRHSDAIGYILPTSSPRFSDPFYSDFLAGLCDEIAEHHIDLIVSSSPPGSDIEMRMYQRWIQSMRVGGIVLNRIRTQDWRASFLAQNQVPFAVLGHISIDMKIPNIVVDERGGFERLVQHLASKGHQRIAYIGGSPDLMIQVDRFGGYQQGLLTAGLLRDKDLILEGDLTEDGGYEAARKLLAQSDPPSAILGCNDLTAIGVLRAARQAGLQVGKDLAVAGYDGIQQTEHTDPPLTTLYQPTYNIARLLAAQLLKVLKGEVIDEYRQTLEPILILRASTG